MKPFFKTKAGLISVALFALVMGAMFYRVARQHASRGAATGSSGTTSRAPTPAPSHAQAADTTAVPIKDARAERGALNRDVAENAAYLEQYYGLENRVREDRDRLGNLVTRRENARTPNDVSQMPIEDEASVSGAARASLRLQGRSTAIHAGTAADSNKIGREVSLPGQSASNATSEPAPVVEKRSVARKEQRARPIRFNPYGSVVRCELVFTIDSTNEQTPLIALITEPVYNNGALIIPAGTELHGVARPDRVRDRILSGEQWIMVFPREGTRPNGRQLSVRGVALDRIEPDANGMTWGITDGSYGLEGRLIRTLQEQEIKRFVATFFSEAAQTLQQRQSDRGNHETIKNTPENAVLQGLSANLQKIADDVTAEIARHGVFIRVPAGHQFYFYPMQLIDPDAADVSSDFATVQ